MKKAIISVSDKTGIEELGKFLQDKGIEIISTGGTAKALESAGVKITKVSDYTGFPEMLDGRVKTLNPKIFAGLLAVRDNPDHITQLKENEIEPIDIVVVNLYPFEETVSKGCTFDEAIEKIDIGGPSLLRAAAKNFRDVIILTNPGRYKQFMSKFDSLDEDFRKKLALDVFSHTARYDSVITNYLDNAEVPNTYFFAGKKVQQLRYGENPYQTAAFYKDASSKEPGLANAQQLQGKELSYNNIMDGDGALNIVKEFTQPACAVIKHANPSGAAVAENIEDALKKAYNADPLSAFGCVIAMNRPFTVGCAEFLKDKFIEVIIAPDFDKESQAIFKEKKNVRLLRLEGIEAPPVNPDKFTTKKVAGGMLIKSTNFPKIDPETIEIEDNPNPTTEQIAQMTSQAKEGELKKVMCVTTKKVTREQLKDMIFALKVCKHVKSNSVLYANDGVTVGIGAGQMSRVDSSIIATRKAGEKAKGSIMVSDAFFPFRDGVDEAAKAGISAIIQPGGSIRDEEVIKAADEHGIAMIFCGTRVFLH
ncbi:bifunctional phosphoribosylaminoimidazolecarboxamide formyltransferase/IMP cyclohydrolase [Candidatus Woesearchaeota archaeon]|nr:bifunctional phosphoribosylaminoimidazolecarboxamide formyltransferase/IMP cyclohydrolase [Candidatus Woesearchaeota archaeon]